MRPIPVFVFCFLLVACGDGGRTGGDDVGDPEVEVNTNLAVSGQPESLTYARGLDVDLTEMERNPTGLYIRDLRRGDGADAQPGDVVRVHYSGWLANGHKFDSSRDRNQPFEFRLGAGQVITGWEVGVTGMRVGGRRQLVIPPELAYGAAGAGGGVIPPHATLIFNIELLEVR